MKGLKNGHINLSVIGIVNVTAGEYPEIEVNGSKIAAYIADALGLDKKDYENVKFPGKVLLTIENFGGNAKIENTMTDDSGVSEPEPEHDVNLLEGDPDAM